MNIRAILTILFIACLCGAHAQDPLISIKSAAPLHFNPAYTGNEYFTRASLNYRNHYPGAGTSFISYAASFDIFLNRYNSGLGIMLLSDQLGSKTFSYNSANIAYSYKININETNALRAGISGNLFYGINDPNGLIFPDMISPDGVVNPNEFTYERNSSFGADFGTGLLFENKRLEAGVALFHLGSPGDLVYWHRPVRIYTHVEMKIPLFAGKTYRPQSEIEDIIKGSSSLTPRIYYQQQGASKLWGAGALAQISALKFGLYSRQDFKFHSVTFSIQAGYSSDIMEVGYMFDMGFIGMTFRGFSTASHELCVIFKFPSSKED
ncbi:MAG: PorP/SprF family type IX secretion system membrane protein [Prevotellaceae bacterium]|jgi:type IX secretion system PorP/SprF family membrane protein|nr:PorP/SprF family type IX secretion system membrane protein [Prevotellaceae bacterium]